MTFEDYRKQRYGDLTSAGKHSYDTDSAYKQRRLDQWHGEFNRQQSSTTTASTTPRSSSASNDPFANDASSTSDIPPDYMSTASLLGISGGEGLGTVGWDYPARDLADADAWGPGNIHVPGGSANLQIYQVLQGYYKLSKDELVSLQKQLYDAGYYPDSVYAKGKAPLFGMNDPKDPGYAAFVNAVETASLRGVSVQAAIRDRAGAGAAGAGAAGPARQGFIFQPTNPIDIKKGADSIAQSDLGRKLTAAEKETFVALYQGLERQSQMSAYTAAGSGLPGGPGGTATQAPNLGAYLEDQIRQRYPTEAGSHDIAQAGSDFFSMLRGKA